jgi:hypothetical protein
MYTPTLPSVSETAVAWRLPLRQCMLGRPRALIIAALLGTNKRAWEHKQPCPVQPYSGTALLRYNNSRESSALPMSCRSRTVFGPKTSIATDIPFHRSQPRNFPHDPYNAAQVALDGPDLGQPQTPPTLVLHTPLSVFLDSGA